MLPSRRRGAGARRSFFPLATQIRSKAISHSGAAGWRSGASPTAVGLGGALGLPRRQRAGHAHRVNGMCAAACRESQRRFARIVVSWRVAAGGGSFRQPSSSGFICASLAWVVHQQKQQPCLAAASAFQAQRACLLPCGAAGRLLNATPVRRWHVSAQACRLPAFLCDLRKRSMCTQPQQPAFLGSAQSAAHHANTHSMPIADCKGTAAEAGERKGCWPPSGKGSAHKQAHHLMVYGSTNQCVNGT